MKTYIFTFDVNNADEIKTGILQTQNKPRSDLPETDMLKEIVKKCLIRFVNNNEKNFRVLEENFWSLFCCYLSMQTDFEKDLEINILSLHLITDKKVLNEKITDTSKKYDIFINCCNVNPSEDYFIFEGGKVIFFNENDYTTTEIQIN